MEIRILKENETVRYAAEELSKYLSMVDRSVSTEITVTPVRSADGITLGLLSELSLPDSDVNDAMIDDVVDVDIVNLCGHIAGSNGRSVLMGVYKYLKSAGCRWVRPGEAGEYIPTADLHDHSFKFRKKADYPFRGQCTEGAIGFEHMRDTVLWLPKVDMNLFMIEQIVPYNYMSRWYKHYDNTKLPHDDIPYERYVEYCEEIEKLVKKCGLQLHVLGHGATNEPLGIRDMGPEFTYEVSEEDRNALALVGGKRELFGGRPFYTQLCMSNEQVQDRVVNWLADYLKKKPHIDFLHFWLSDSANNHCECEECVKMTPSDWYVRMLNKLDEKLTEQGNPAKIIFIIYVDTLWAPIREKLNNPSRFIMTTACGEARSYTGKRREGGVPKWERNKFTINEGLDLGLVFVDAWKSVFDGPKFLYDYFLYVEHFTDPGYMRMARRTAKNSKEFKVMGFEGIMSDQTQRAYFPTGLPSSVFGEFMFDTSLETESYIDEYLEKSFGADYKAAKEYLDKISEIFDFREILENIGITAFDTGLGPICSKGSPMIGSAEIADAVSAVAPVVDAFFPTVEKNLRLADSCHRESWRILSYHAEYCKRLAKMYYALARSGAECARAELSELMDYLSEIEMEIHPYFDLCLFHKKMDWVIKGR